VIDTIKLAHTGLRALGITSPRIAVCGLNPHAGDGGLLGSEEKKIILPAVRACRSRGIKVEGPLSPDVVWPLVLNKTYDIGVAMYHDQGQIAVKLMGFKANSVEGVNVTLGLPFPRVSVDHGTAYDIAGRGIASERSMVDALVMAGEMSKKNV
jgi:4-hydroxythreonine-4-phosphate dehydrogenase